MRRYLVTDFELFFDENGVNTIPNALIIQSYRQLRYRDIERFLAKRFNIKTDEIDFSYIEVKELETVEFVEP